MTRARTALAVAVAALALGAACTPDPPADPAPSPGASQSPGGNTGTTAATTEVATTAAGPVRGVTQLGMRTWLGVPFAAPPVGDARWRGPQPVKAWRGVRPTTTPGANCLQPWAGGAQPNSSEDCLYLNVYRPATGDTDLPVIVNFHGGGLSNGTGFIPPANVRGLVNKGVIVVSTNYRLGRLGYFAHPALADEAHRAGERPVANFGLLDQIAALEWVRDNIAGFGGDPGRVTIHGTSAGGMSVNFLMVSPRARGLFHRAIARSGLGHEQPPHWSRAAREGERIATSLGARSANAAELRRLDAVDIVQVPTEILLGHLPIQDAVLPEPVSEAFKGGREAAVPYISGTTDGEFLDAHLHSLGIDPVSQREQLLSGREGEAAAVYGGGEETERRVLNDLLETLPVRELAAQHAERAPSYRYRFTATTEALRAQLGGAIHGSDQFFPFGVSWPAVPGSARLSKDMTSCFASFVETGTPDCGVEWPKADTGGLLEFGSDGIEVHESDPWERRLDFVAKLGWLRP